MIADVDLLIDTHVLVWFEARSAKISAELRETIERGAGRRAVSLGSVWEMALLLAKGRLPEVAGLFPGAADRLRGRGYEVLPIKPVQVERSALLPSIHGDPFDRLLVATAELEGLTLVTADRQLHRYGVPCLW